MCVCVCVSVHEAPCAVPAAGWCPEAADVSGAHSDGPNSTATAVETAGPAQSTHIQLEQQNNTETARARARTHTHTHTHTPINSETACGV